MKIRTRLLLMLVVAALVPLYLVGWFALRANADAHGEGEDAALTSRANELAADVDGFVRGTLEALRADAGLPVLVRYTTADAMARAAMALDLRASLRSVAAKDPIHVMSAALLGPDGRVLADTALATSTDTHEGATPCVAQALSSGVGALEGPRYQPGARSPFIFFCYPVRDPRGRITGLLRLRVSAARLQAIVWKGTLNDLRGRHVVVLGLDGVVLAHSSQPGWLLHTRVGGNAASDAVLRHEGRLAPDGSIRRLAGAPPEPRSRPVLAWLDVADDRLRAAAVRVRDTDWQLVVFVPEAVWRAGAESETRTAVLLGALLTGLLLAAAWIAAAHIAGPIVRLTELADRIGLQTPMPLLPVSAGGEVGRLARALQGMTARQEDTLAKLAEQVAEQRATAKRLQVSESRLAALFNLSPLPLLLTDRDDGTVVDLNASFVGQFGPMAARLAGATLADLSREPCYPRFDRLAAELDDGGEVDHVVQVDADSGTRSLRVFGRAFESGGRHLAVWTCVDVTETENARRALEDLNASLESRVERRTTELRETLNRLQHTQDELVRAEKLAALGGLVAGVAHELNTPIGNSVTVASTIAERTEQLAADIASGQLRRSQLDDYVQSMQSAADLIDRNLARARTLVTSFKKVSVDRVSEARRSFDVAEVVTEVVATLEPGLKGQAGRLVLELSSVQMDSYPGAVGQIVTNLVNNAMLHAFDGRREGVVTLSTRPLPEGWMALDCRDDGRGMDAETRRRIFDPFFTTKFGHGGSGLGMHIVYNLVTRVLGGRIQIDSEPGQGACFHVQLPCVAPDEAA